MLAFNLISNYFTNHEQRTKINLDHWKIYPRCTTNIYTEPSLFHTILFFASNVIGFANYADDNNLLYREEN